MLNSKTTSLAEQRWHMPLIPVLQRRKQMNLWEWHQTVQQSEYQDNQSCSRETLSQKKQKTKNKKNKKQKKTNKTKTKGSLWPHVARTENSHKNQHKKILEEEKKKKQGEKRENRYRTQNYQSEAGREREKNITYPEKQELKGEREFKDQSQGLWECRGTFHKVSEPYKKKISP